MMVSEASSTFSPDFISCVLAGSGGVQREGLRQCSPLLDRGGERHPQCPVDRAGEIRAL